MRQERNIEDLRTRADDGSRYEARQDGTGSAASTYINANIQEVATALAAMTCQPHPLALPSEH